ncbi:TRAP transporter large permease [Collimonas sp. OK412]|jgi:tripartite ATP-independent transporter DctM subunit|uniref:TRAP transporter large permease n=1 Tax=Collimonas sp. (strain OK412) TaxID=1801619 RepID=UPI0008F0ACA8|nr:TRAP transporter large permease [Collimonas sp. OK412]SFC71900.1 TRAP transporter, DctM subunit [Collimonas sp. OK412]
MALTLLSLSFLVLLLIGVPISFSIGLSAIATIFYEGLPIAVIFQRMTAGMSVFSFLTIPFFIFAGELMLYGGIADRIIQCARGVVGHIRGGLGMTNVLACTLFGGVSGSPVADISAMGAVMIPMMKRENYDTDYAVNVTTHSSLVGVLMPTSHNIIIYALVAGGGVSITTLILAGLLPALILTLANLAVAYLVAVHRGYPAGTFLGWQVALRSILRAVPGLMVVVIIIAGITSGVFTATESAAIAVFYALILTTLVYRSLSWADFLKAAVKSVKTTGVILMLISISSAFGYLISLYSVADTVGDALMAVSSNPIVIFLLINLALLLFGTFLDMAAHILICTPIFLPICEHFGMGPVQFGMMLLINCSLGLNAPPIGAAQIIGCTIGGIRMGEIMRTIWPFYLALLFTLMLVTFVPGFSLWIPGWFA